MATTPNHYILIMCGGSGPRLWPLSRSSHPKQFLKLFGQKSLLQNTFDRFSRIVPSQNIFIVTQQKYFGQIKKDLGSAILTKNILCEPDKKNTAMAILFGVQHIAKINPEAIITSTPADHFVSLKRYFRKSIRLAVQSAATTNKIVLIGIHPTYPNPGFGYILAQSSGPIRQVTQFVEKPSVVDAQLLIHKDALWNSGIYTFSISSLLDEFTTHEPIYSRLYHQLSLSHQPKNIINIYKKSPSLPLDKAISEKSQNLVTLKAKFVWSDIGEWFAIWQHLTQTENGIKKISPASNYLSINSKNCLVNGPRDKLIGLVGLNNLAIIDSPDGLLVCNLQDTYSVRELVKEIVSTPKLKNFFLS
ncbi:MAG: mannose-1-phosphate guanylyltransferase [Microgenomates group bacterium]